MYHWWKTDEKDVKDVLARLFFSLENGTTIRRHILLISAKCLLSVVQDVLY